MQPGENTTLHFTITEDAPLGIHDGSFGFYGVTPFKDAAPEIRIKKMTRVFPDETAPILTEQGKARKGIDAGHVQFTSNEAGNYYYAVVDHGAAVPTIDTSGDGVVCDVSKQTLPLTANELTDAGAKDVYIVVKDVHGNISDAGFYITVPAYAPSLSVSPQTLDFGRLKVGQQPVALTTTLTNTGSESLTLTLPSVPHYTIVVDGAAETMAPVLAPGEKVTLRIQPENGLAAGTYDAELVFSAKDVYDTEITAAQTLHFTVIDQNGGGTVVSPNPNPPNKPDKPDQPDRPEVEDPEKTGVAQWLDTKKPLQLSEWLS